MTSMNPLEKETLKYEKKGFKIAQRRTLKYGSRTYLLKKGGWLSSDIGVYIYYVDGDATSESIRDRFKDYMRFYKDHNFTDEDKGFFICSGSVEEKLFRDLRKAVIDDDDIRNSIKLAKVTPSAQKEPVDSSSGRVSPLTHDETERIIHRVGTICCYPNCKETIALDVHHIISREEGGTNRDNNLIVLCPVHHRLADRGAIPRKRLEMYSVTKMEDRRL